MQVINAERKNKGEILSSIVGGTFSLTLSTIIVKILGLIYKIPLSNMLGDEGMGYFNSAYTVFAFFYLLCTAGVPKAVMILISEAKAKGRIDEEKRIIKVASGLFLTIGVIITLAFILFSGPIALLIGNSRSAATMVAIAPSIIFISLSGVIRGFLSANMRLIDIAVSQIIEGVGRLVLGLVFAMVAKGLKMSSPLISAFTILGVTLGALFGLVYLVICAKFKINGQKTGQSNKKINFKLIIKRILSISIPITISAAIMSVTNIIDLGLIMRSLVKIGYTEAEASALYGNYTTLAVPMFNLATSIITPISIAYLPLFTRHAINGDYDSLDMAQKNALEITSFVGAPMMIGLIVFAKEILRLLFSNSEIEIGAMLLCMISPAILFSSLLMIVNTVLESYGRVKAPLISMLIGSLSKIVVSYLFITKSDLGILGAPMGTLICYATALFVSIIIYSRVAKRHIPLFRTSIIPHINAFVAVGMSRLCFEGMIFSLSESISLVISILLAALLYVILSMFTGALSVAKLIELSKYTKLTQ